MIKLCNEWDQLLADEFKKEYYLKLREILKKEYKTQTVYPSMYDIFNALKYTSYSDVSVVVLGQDPYHQKGQAHGLAFSVPDGVPNPPSLQNIFKEIQDDIGISPPQSGNLTYLTKQGVLLLNTALTVREGQANSHKDIGWEIFTNEIIRLLNDSEKPMVFMLWGANARNKKELLTNKKHLILECAHPSPLSVHRGFFGCKHFSQANEFLQNNGRNTINY